jgi:transposase-like protein
VDESKFGKRKYNRGRRIEGAWVIGGVERSAEKKFFVEVVERRDSMTILDVLSRHIIPGSIVHTDCWKGYHNIENDLDIAHHTVNHSISFIDYETDVHTNSIEGKWAGLKNAITLRGKVTKTLDGHLLEHIWRFKHQDAIWKGLLHAFKTVYYE